MCHSPHLCDNFITLILDHYFFDVALGDYISYEKEQETV